MSTLLLPPPTAVQRANFRDLYLDVAWFGVLSGSAMSFLSVYATRLGASAFEIGLLNAGPAVINLLITLPAGRWLEERSLTQATFLSSLWHRLGYVMLMILPWLLAGPAQVSGIIWVTLAMSLPGTVLAISFNAMFAEVVPPEWRGHVVGRRNALIAITSTLTALLSGRILDRLAFPLNYQLVFAIGALGALMSSYHLGRLRPRSVWPKLSNDAVRRGWRAFAHWLGTWRSRLRQKPRPHGGGKPLLRLDVLSGAFGPLLAGYLLFYTFQYTALPLFPLYNVRELKLSDGAISIGSALFNAFIMLGSLRMGVIPRRLGNRRALWIGALLFGQYPLLLGLARNSLMYWAASVSGGLVWALLTVGLINRLMERVPEDDRPAHMAWHNVALNLGILIGSFLGPAMGDWLGLRTALFVSSGLRLLAGLMFKVLDRPDEAEDKS